MTSFTFSHAEADDGAGLAKSLADGLKAGAGNGGDRLGFIYVTDKMADELGSILTYLRQSTGVENWVGSVGIGICASGVEYFDRRAGVAAGAVSQGIQMIAAHPPTTRSVAAVGVVHTCHRRTAGGIHCKLK